MGPRRVTIGSMGHELDRAGGFDGLEGFAPERTPARGGGSRRRIRDAHRWSWPARTLLILSIVALTVFVAGAVAVDVLVDPEEVGRWIAPRAADALNRDVTVGAAGISLLPRPALRLADLRVGNPDGIEGPAVAAVDVIRFDIALVPLLTGRVRLARPDVQGARLHLAVNEAGISNFGDLVPEGGFSLPEMSAPVSFDFREISFGDASLTFFDAARERSFAVAGTAGELHVGPNGDGGWLLEGSGVADSLHVRAPRVMDEILRTDGPRFTLRAIGDDALDGLQIESATVEQSGQTLELRGRLAGFSGPDPTVDVRIVNPRFDAQVLSSFVPAGIRSRTLPRAEGSLAIALRLRGPLDGPVGPKLSGTVGLADVGVRLNAAPLLGGVAGTVVMDGDTLRLDSISGTFAEGPFHLVGSWVASSGELLASVTASPDLDALDRVGLVPDGTTLAGEAEVELSVSGSLEAPDSMEADGRVRVTGLRLEHPRFGAPVYLPVAEADLRGGDVLWDSVTVLVGEEPLRTSGRLGGGAAALLEGVAPRVEATVSAERLTLASEDGGASPGYARIAFAHLGGRDVEGRRAAVAAEEAGLRRPRALPLHGSIDLDVGTLTSGRRVLSALIARIELDDSTLAVRDASFGMWSGSVRGSLVLGVGERLDEPFALSLEGEGLDARTFLAETTPIGEAVVGNLEMVVDLTGTTDLMLLPLLQTLAGTATVTVSDGSVSGTAVNLALADFLGAEEWSTVPFETWSTQLVLRDEMVQAERSRLVGDLGRVRLSGAIGLGGAVDLAMGLSIPPDRLRAVSLRRTGVAQSVLDHLRATGSPLDLGIRVSGTLEGPTLEPDALAASPPAPGR